MEELPVVLLLVMMRIWVVNQIQILHVCQMTLLLEMLILSA